VCACACVCVCVCVYACQPGKNKTTQNHTKRICELPCVNVRCRFVNIPGCNVISSENCVCVCVCVRACERACGLCVYVCKCVSTYPRVCEFPCICVNVLCLFVNIPGCDVISSENSPRVSSSKSSRSLSSSDSMSIHEYSTKKHMCKCVSMCVQICN
jgi:hypothetical protein